KDMRAVVNAIAETLREMGVKAA
ncbi:MAG: hypothetical protein RJB04_226, partial [Verrucomicrobiota bacterium]